MPVSSCRIHPRLSSYPPLVVYCYLIRVNILFNKGRNDDRTFSEILSKFRNSEMPKKNEITAFQSEFENVHEMLDVFCDSDSETSK